MIKVMHVLTDTNIGGAGIWLLNYLKFRNKQKYDVTVVLPDGAMLIPKVENLGARVIKAKSIADRSFSKEGILELRRIIKAEKPDVIHSHASFDARVAAKLCRVKTIHTRHCLEAEKSGIKKLVYSLVNNMLSSKVIGVSEAVVENLAKDGIKKSKLNMIYNGIEPIDSYPEEEKLNLRQKYGFDTDSVVVGLVARLENVKNPLLFIEAAKLTAKRCPNSRFIIVGDGSLRKKSEEAAKTLGERLVFTGYMDNVAPAYNVMDIITITSDSEALSISLIEGQSLGLAAISTDAGGTDEVIENNVNGYIVPVGNAEALSEAMVKLIQNPGLRENFGLNGKTKVERVFGIEETAQKTEALYNNLVRR